ncbi:hypothetical protein A2954_00825 [Candidatus Roizmanbacteria bacterium RIFCSPLOWO2_01_FULL_37_12]|uniref:Glycosyltransferase RgtA/B/C/D-like domain-containing protein n=1 Tax=Candidatus Roizmanbacteria bacterium RIFCSPLOWO2_01_FULL_37_12 TaxID=1802056 RepID=A0A1F7IDT6_9BACT|nr:MAG: hypothetical protein A3D76_01010 [Candidatus Roizmanbacteria bacterium RIFCSPHIGHO2_02_FULL_37_9b]OGK41530.1 MAG: hypothetical protein A2954_00825 [Candidatus Roizmanbacteria bacterium RIFCSPLOWO2_01_FULL_37_12]
MSTHNIYLIAIILGLFISVSFFSEDFNLGSDFISYYTGASLLKNRQGNRLYHIEEQKSFQKKFPKYSDLILLPFKAVPFVALFFLPLSYLRLENAYLIFAYLNISVLFLIYLIAKKVFIHITGERLFLILIFLSPALFLALLNAQTSIFLTLVMLLIYISLKKRSWLMVGILSGFILIKVQLITLIPFLFLLSKNKKKFLLGLILSLTLLFLVSLHAVGLSELLRYPDFILKTENEAYGSIIGDSFSLSSLFSPLVKIGLINMRQIFLGNVFFYMLALFLFNIQLKRHNLSWLFILSSILAILFSMHTLAYDLSILTVSIFILLDQYFQLKNKMRKNTLEIAKLLFGLVFFLIIPIIFGVHFNFGPLVLLVVIFTLLKNPLPNYVQ